MNLNPWASLLFAGLFEIGFTTCMKLSEGFTKATFVAGFVFFAVLSFICLSHAAKVIPLGTSYAVWTGLGAFGTALVGVFFFNDPASPARIVLLILLIGSIVGLKFVSDAGY
ncbi:MAG: QacE family quaternary ammonium compound efflux SMR transporter [Proteobacteria bacterium]|nr:QacE family quaternary ammonium compound efflux SMR transporter [Pseudomonadota bacterium]